MARASRITIAVVLTATVTVVCSLFALLESDVGVALLWFRIGLTFAALGGCVAAVLFVLDKDRWHKEAYAVAIAEATSARERVVEASGKFEHDLAMARKEVAEQFEGVLREIAEIEAYRAVTGWSTSGHARMRLIGGSGDTYTTSWPRSDH